MRAAVWAGCDDRVVEVGGYAIADFICPTPATREAFIGKTDAFVVWVDRIKAGRFEDTNRMFEAPGRFDLRVTSEGAPEYWADVAARLLRPVFDPKKCTTLMIGRYQPFHDGHRSLILEAIQRVGQVRIAVRGLGQSTDPKNPFSFEQMRSRIEHGLRAHEGRFTVISCPISPTCFTR